MVRPRGLMDRASLSAGGDCESYRALSRFPIQESSITSSHPSIAQLVEHLTVDQMVPGSIPGRRILIWNHPSRDSVFVNNYVMSSRSYSVVVITVDFDSTDTGSNPVRTFCVERLARKKCM